MTDRDILLSIRPNANESQIEYFCERVAIMVESNVNIDIAIATALISVDYAII